MKRLLILFWALFFMASMQVEAQNIYLVSAGVTDYPGTGKDLRFPANDARAVHRLYKKNARATSVLLTNKNAEKDRILSSAKALFSKAGPEDIVVFFFSGHGYPGGFVAYDGRMTYEEIRSIFSTCKASSKMVFADACFSGDIREGKGTGQSAPSGNIMLFLSSRSNETSIERGDMKNGLFVASLLRALKGRADENRDSTITASELFRAVSERVSTLSWDRQHPVMWGKFSDDMPVMVW